MNKDSSNGQRLGEIYNEEAGMKRKTKQNKKNNVIKKPC